MGFKVTWKLINVGLRCNNSFQSFLFYDEMFDYLNYCLGRNEEQIDNIISLLCEKENRQNIAHLLTDFAESDHSCELIQYRKWKACTLMKILDKEHYDFLQGILELLEFWNTYDCTKKIPIDFPSQSANINQEYFTEIHYEKLINQSSHWLKEEVQNITHLECNIIGL